MEVKISYHGSFHASRPSSSRWSFCSLSKPTRFQCLYEWSCPEITWTFVLLPDKTFQNLSEQSIWPLQCIYKHSRLETSTFLRRPSQCTVRELKHYWWGEGQKGRIFLLLQAANVSLMSHLILHTNVAPQHVPQHGWQVTGRRLCLNYMIRCQPWYVRRLISKTELSTLLLWMIVILFYYILRLAKNQSILME